MAKKQKGAEKTKNSNGANVGYEAELWKWLTPCAAAWMRRGTSTSSSASYFFKYISDAFEEQHAKLEAEKKHGADPEDSDEYRALNIFWVPPEARRAHLKAQAKQATIGQLVDDAMTGIERDNPSLKGVPPQGLHPSRPRQTTPRSAHRSHQCAGRNARTLQGSRLRSLLRLLRHVRAIRELIAVHDGKLGDVSIYDQERNATIHLLTALN